MIAASLLLRGATVVDGTGAPPRPDTDVLVTGDRIVAVGQDLQAPDGATELDLRGRWIVAGLIDAHVHLMHVPGQDWLDPALVDDLQRRQLASYLACGVTTVLDAGTLPDRMARIQAWIAEGTPAPRVLILGEVLGPAGGYPETVGPGFHGLSGPADVAPALDRAVAMGAVGTKVTFERGFGGEDWPLFGPEMRAAIRSEAGSRGLPIFVHAMTPSEFLPALDLAPRAFMHAPEHPDRQVTRAIAESDAYLVTTLTVYDAPRMAMSERRMADPLLRAAVPAELVSAGLDRATAVRSRQALAAMAAPWAPRWMAGIGFTARTLAAGKLRRATAAVHDLHVAGVPLVLGTDSGTWPLIHTQFPGWASIRELELLAKAGLDPAEVLAAGTTTPARMLGVFDELGTVEVGKAADLVVLAADPLEDPTAYRTVVLTVHQGVAKSPAQWVAR